MSTPSPATTNWVPLWNLNGAAGMNYRGAYVGATNYTDGDVVVYNNVAYLCVRPTVNPPAAWSTMSPSLVQADAAWHYVGQAGEPAFQNSWVNYSIGGTIGGWINARFRRLASGMVDMQGLIKNGAAGVIFTLPPGYRPGVTPGYSGLIFAADSSAGHYRLDVNQDGGVITSLAAPAYFSLASVHFYADA